MLNNLPIRRKLIAAFLTVSTLCAVVGLFGFTGLNALKAGMKTVYDDRVVPLAQLNHVSEGYTAGINSTLQLLDGKAISWDSAATRIRESRAGIEKEWGAYLATYLTPEESGLVDQFKPLKAHTDSVTARFERAVAAHDAATVHALASGEMEKVIAPAMAALGKVAELQVRVAREETEKGMATAAQRTWWLAGITAVAMAIAVWLGVFLAGLIVTPLNAIRDAARRIAVGDVNQEIAHRSGDELGDLAEATRQMVTYNKDVAAAVERLGRGDLAQPMAVRSPEDLVAQSVNATRDRLTDIIRATGTLAQAAGQGDLAARGDTQSYAGAYRDLMQGLNGLVDAVATPIADVNGALGRLAARDLATRVTADYQGDFGAMRDSFNAAAEALAQAMREVRAASAQVAGAAGEIQNASQTLANGASEQASSIEEVSASLQESVAGAKQTAANTAEARQLAADAQAAVRGGTEGMTELSGAIERIKASTDQTARILRTIDEVAFQTNLLALNAAVEAARAGEAGRGFAVVAEEVRALAGRTSEAAKQTAQLIEQSLASANQGVQLNEVVVKAFVEIDRQVQRVGAVVAEVATAADGQSEGAHQIGIGVDQVSTVTQQNAAAAEEAAAAAEELNAQARALEGLVGQFTLDAARGPALARPAARPAAPTARHAAPVRRPATKAVTPVTARFARAPEPDFAVAGLATDTELAAF